MLQKFRARRHRRCAHAASGSPTRCHDTAPRSGAGAHARGAEAGWGLPWRRLVPNAAICSALTPPFCRHWLKPEADTDCSAVRKNRRRVRGSGPHEEAAADVDQRAGVAAVDGRTEHEVEGAVPLGEMCRATEQQREADEKEDDGTGRRRHRDEPSY